MVLAGLLSLGLCSFVIAKFTEDDSADRFTTEAVLLNMADAALASGPPEVFDPGAAPGAEERASSRAPATPIYSEKQAQVKPGDNLAVITQRVHGFEPRVHVEQQFHGAGAFADGPEIETELVYALEYRERKGMGKNIDDQGNAPPRETALFLSRALAD